MIVRSGLNIQPSKTPETLAIKRLKENTGQNGRRLCGRQQGQWKWEKVGLTWGKNGHWCFVWSTLGTTESRRIKRWQVNDINWKVEKRVKNKSMLCRTHDGDRQTHMHTYKRTHYQDQHQCSSKHISNHNTLEWFLKILLVWFFGRVHI